MPLLRTWRRRSTHAILAWVIACLFVLQGAALATSSAFAIGAGDSVAACRSVDGDQSPTRGQHDHSGCCVFCSSCARDAALIVVALLAAIATYYRPPSALGFIVPFVTTQSIERPVGWVSSWSSRAPPAI